MGDTSNKSSGTKAKLEGRGNNDKKQRKERMPAASRLVHLALEARAELFHTPDQVEVNQLTIDATDPKSGTAEFKAAAVRVEKLPG